MGDVPSYRNNTVYIQQVSTQHNAKYAITDARGTPDLMRTYIIHVAVTFSELCDLAGLSARWEKVLAAHFNDLARPPPKLTSCEQQ